MLLNWKKKLRTYILSSTTFAAHLKFMVNFSANFMALICGLWHMKSSKHFLSPYLYVYEASWGKEREKSVRFQQSISNLHKLYQPEMRKAVCIRLLLMHIALKNFIHVSFHMECMNLRMESKWRTIETMRDRERQREREKIKKNFHFRSVNMHEIFTFVVNYWNSHKINAWFHNENGTNYVANLNKYYSVEIFSAAT